MVYKIISLWPDVFHPFTQPFSRAYITVTNYHKLFTQKATHFITKLQMVTIAQLKYFTV
jgi:hypothetical protein